MPLYKNNAEKTLSDRLKTIYGQREITKCIALNCSALQSKPDNWFQTLYSAVTDVFEENDPDIYAFDDGDILIFSSSITNKLFQFFYPQLVLTFPNLPLENIAHHNQEFFHQLTSLLKTQLDPYPGHVFCHKDEPAFFIWG